jgi:hypothetical protein
VEGCKEITNRFLAAVDHNLRSRALVFTPFYHPILFLKSLLLSPFRKDARSILIQAEYDRWFYDSNSLDELPSVARSRNIGTKAGTEGILLGPMLVLNTTSLNSGERRAFSRGANTRLAELKTSNKNVLKLSRVVAPLPECPSCFHPRRSARTCWWTAA